MNENELALALGDQKFNAMLAGQYDPDLDPEVKDITFTVPMTFEKQELWDSIIGSAFEVHPWWRKIVWDESNFQITLAIENPDDPAKAITKTLTMKDIVEACKKVWVGKHYHCFGIPIDSNIDNYDSCAGDAILQVAMLGEVVYG